MTRRLFISIEPSVDFSKVIRSLHSGLDGALWESQPHLTVSHFGHVGAGRVDELTVDLQNVSFEPFELQPDRLGVFGEVDSPSVVWLGFKPSADSNRSTLNSHRSGPGLLHSRTGTASIRI